MPELTQNEQERVRAIAERLRAMRERRRDVTKTELARDAEYLLGLLNETPPTRIPVKLL